MPHRHLSERGGWRQDVHSLVPAAERLPICRKAAPSSQRRAPCFHCACLVFTTPGYAASSSVGSCSVSERPPSSDIPQMFHLTCLVWMVILNATRAKTGSNKLKPHLLMRQACVGLSPGVKIWKGFSFWISISSDNPIKEKIYWTLIAKYSTIALHKNWKIGISYAHTCACVYLCGHMCHGGLSDNLRSQFFLTWVPGIEYRLLDFVAGTFTHSSLSIFPMTVLEIIELYKGVDSILDPQWDKKVDTATLKKLNLLLTNTQKHRNCTKV